ncbi:unnamed protein product [Victoria cruziana]
MPESGVLASSAGARNGDDSWLWGFSVDEDDDVKAQTLSPAQTAQALNRATAFSRAVVFIIFVTLDTRPFGLA